MASRSSSSSTSASTKTVSVGDQQKINIALTTIDAFNSHRLDSSRSVLADNYVVEAPGTPGPLDRERGLAYNQTFLDAFPDLHFDVTHAISQGDFVVVQWVGTGTHSGRLVAPNGGVLEPTNRRARVMGCTVSEIKQGKIVHDWVYWDMTSLLGQLGKMPPI